MSLFKKPAEANGPAPATKTGNPPWRVLIVDDEPEVHSMTRLILGDFEFLGRGIEFLDTESCAETKRLLQHESDIALAFVDVVMDGDEAGLELVDHIRKDLGNDAMRIILRTGQPGKAPERQVIRKYEINDYISKTSASTDKIFSATLAALRSYDGIMAQQRAQKQLERYRDGLEAVIVASSSLFEMRSLRLLASGLLRQISALLFHSKQSMLLQINGMTLTQNEGNFTILARTGRFDHDNDDVLPPEVLEILQKALASRSSIVVGNTFIGYFPTKRGIVNLIYLDGVADVGPVELKLIEVFSNNISVAFENLYLDQEIADTQAEIISVLGDIMETRSHEAANHVRRVAHLAHLIGNGIGLDEEQCALLKNAVPMHDIGKVAIPDTVLLKPGPLDPEEWNIMRRHAEIGEAIFAHSARPILKAAAIIAGQHHERFDGSGYPRRLKGEAIHIFGRIVAVADVFDALTHSRCYKQAWPMPRVVEQLRVDRGSHFDPLLIDFLLDNLHKAIEILNTFPDEATRGKGSATAAPGENVESAAMFTIPSGEEPK